MKQAPVLCVISSSVIAVIRLFFVLCLFSGAAGLSATATAGVASVGGATGALVGGAVNLLKRMRK